MKTAEEWASILNEIGPDELTIDTVQEIQLDAMKDGMWRAAMVVGRNTYPKHIQRQELESAYDDGAIDKRKAILTAAEQLTEKDF